VINVMGGSDLDLNDVELSDPVTHLNVYSLMGGSQVRVPNGVDVHVSRLALMGGNDVRLGDELPPPGLRRFASGWCRSWGAPTYGEVAG